jgi:hypothetical protein
MTTIKEAKEFDLEAHIMRGSEVSYRGGSLKIDVSEIFPGVDSDEAIMGAYQNYLGGGIAGAIQSGSMFSPQFLNAKDRKVFEILSERIKKFFFELNNGGGDEYMQENFGTFEHNQALPKSGY